jgi:hypothetical protein
MTINSTSQYNTEYHKGSKLRLIAKGTKKSAAMDNLHNRLIAL